jgi:hypothetical protein
MLLQQGNCWLGSGRPADVSNNTATTTTTTTTSSSNNNSRGCGCAS